MALPCLSNLRSQRGLNVFLRHLSLRLSSCVVADNNVHDMDDAGIAILESFDAEIYSNNITNVVYGIRISLGAGNNQIFDNVFDTCSVCEWVTESRNVHEIVR